MIMSQEETSIWKTIVTTYKGEGVRGFFKGIMSPVISSIPYNSLVFTVFESARRLIDDRHPGTSKEVKSFLAGTIAGG